MHKRFLVKAARARDKVEGSLQDVTDSSRATEELQFMANNDALTKVLNRRGIERELERALAGMDSGHPLALAYLDLDRFKLINDLFGHNAGDEVLQQRTAHRGVGRGQRGAQEVHAEPGPQEVLAVGQQRQDDIALLDAEPGKRGRRLAGLFQRLPICPGGAVLERGIDPVGVRRGLGLQHMAQHRALTRGRLRRDPRPVGRIGGGPLRPRHCRLSSHAWRRHSPR